MWWVGARVPLPQITRLLLGELTPGGGRAKACSHPQISSGTTPHETPKLIQVQTHTDTIIRLHTAGSLVKISGRRATQQNERLKEKSERKCIGGALPCNTGVCVGFVAKRGSNDKM